MEMWIEEWLKNSELAAEARWPRKLVPSLRAAPRVGEIFWCRFPDPRCIELPEIWKMRPCVVVSRKNRLYGKVTVLPFSTSRRNEREPSAVEASERTRRVLDGKRTWILCDHPMTIATSRLQQMNRGPVRLPREDLDCILRLLHEGLAIAMT